MSTVNFVYLCGAFTVINSLWGSYAILNLQTLNLIPYLQSHAPTTDFLGHNLSDFLLSGP